MPLKKSASKQAFKSNVRAEVKSGKPIKQAVAHIRSLGLLRKPCAIAVARALRNWNG